MLCRILIHISYTSVIFQVLLSLLQFLEWLLQKVKEPSIIHDVLWLFNCSLSEHPVQQMVARRKAEEKGQKNTKVPNSSRTC